MFRWDLMLVNWAATPKSASLTFPVSDRRTLAALISRWILPSVCRYWIPSSSSRQTMAMCASLKFAGFNYQSMLVYSLRGAEHVSTYQIQAGSAAEKLHDNP